MKQTTETSSHVIQLKRHVQANAAEVLMGLMRSGSHANTLHFLVKFTATTQV